VMLRCPSRVALAGALLALGFGLQPIATRAASVNPNSSTATATYRLTSSVNIAAPGSTNLQTPQVVALITPAGSVIPPTNADGTQGSPLTILPTSAGFDTSQLWVALKDGTTSAGQPQQEIGLVFFGQGLKAGGVLDFTLSIDSALASNPPVLTSQTPGITITAEPNTSTTTSGVGTNSSGSGSEVPEPVGIILWSTVLVGLVARRRLRPSPPG
jgi:hypothetical protein